MSAPSGTGRRAGVWPAGVLVFVAVAALAGAGLRGTSGGRQTTSPEPRESPLLPCDALCNRVRSELRVFTDWLARWGVRGYVGEIGIPGNESADRWNALADRWYRDADVSGLWVTTWATGEWWNPGYMLATYGRSGPEGTPLDTPTSQSSVIEANLDGPGLRGVNVPAGPSTAGSVEAKHPSGFSNKTLGKLPDRHIQRESLRFLAGRGIEVVRLPFNWERLQPVLGGPLAEGELAHLREVISVAGSLGMTVVVDMHNFGGYYEWDAAAGTGVRKVIGTTLPVATFADTWARIARALGDHPNVVWDLMNEPARMAAAGGRTPAQVWEQASQAAVDAIRATGDTHTITVAGYDYSPAARWASIHPAPWIRDPLDKIRYQAHHYWDTAQSGEYRLRYDDELAKARSAGYSESPDADPTYVAGDTLPPAVTLHAPSATVRGTVDVVASILDESPGNYYAVVERSGSVIAGPRTVTQFGQIVASPLFRWNTTRSPNGTYTIRVEARDAFGNKGTGSVQRRTVTVSN